MRRFDKPAIDVQQQLDLLKARGLEIQDPARARSFLEVVSFFRLSPYMRPFECADDPKHGLRAHTGFRSLTRLYDFDRRLRLLTMDAIARHLNLVAPLLASWLHTLTTVRNICAHHARLWNRELGIRPELPKKAHFPWPQSLKQAGAHNRVFPLLCILNHLMRQVSPNTSWDKRLRGLLAEFPEVDLRAMGFPEHWQQDPFWHVPD